MCNICILNEHKYSVSLGLQHSPFALSPETLYCPGPGPGLMFFVSCLKTKECCFFFVCVIKNHRKIELRKSHERIIAVALMILFNMTSQTIREEINKR